jgi:hypothetical protein
LIKCKALGTQADITEAGKERVKIIVVATGCSFMKKLENPPKIAIFSKHTCLE